MNGKKGRVILLPVIIVAFILIGVWPTTPLSGEEKGRVRQEAVFQASFDEAWEAALQALKRANFPISAANKVGREIVSLRYISADELYSVAFLPKADVVIRAGFGRLRITFVPQVEPEKIVVKANQDISALATVLERRASRFVRGGELTVPQPRFVEGLSFGIIEDSFLASMEKILTAQKKG